MTSIWLDEIAPDVYPSLHGDVAADVAIVGAGIAGIATAYHLARAGAKAIVLEARAVAEAASGRNAGFLLAGVAENFAAAAKRYGEERALRVWRFTRHNQQLVRAVVAREQIECDLAWNGSAQIAGDDAEWAEACASAERLRREGVRVRLVPEERAAIYEEDGELHPVKYVRGLARAAARSGARIFENTRVTAVAPDGLGTERGRVRAGAVVVCVNAYSQHLVPLRIRPVRGQMLATAPVARRVFDRPAYAHRGYRYWRQRADGRLLVGGWRDTAVDEEVGEEERRGGSLSDALLAPPSPTGGPGSWASLTTRFRTPAGSRMASSSTRGSPDTEWRSRPRPASSSPTSSAARRAMRPICIRRSGARASSQARLQTRRRV